MASALGPYYTQTSQGAKGTVWSVTGREELFGPQDVQLAPVAARPDEFPFQAHPDM